jgi:hypothetical protein
MVALLSFARSVPGIVTKASGSSVGQHRLAARNIKQVREIVLTAQGMGRDPHEAAPVRTALGAAVFSDWELKRRFSKSHMAKQDPSILKNPKSPHAEASAAVWALGVYQADPRGQAGQHVGRNLSKLGSRRFGDASLTSPGGPKRAPLNLEDRAARALKHYDPNASQGFSNFVSAQKQLGKAASPARVFAYQKLYSEKEFAETYRKLLAKNASAEERKQKEPSR